MGKCLDRKQFLTRYEDKLYELEMFDFNNTICVRDYNTTFTMIKETLCVRSTMRNRGDGEACFNVVSSGGAEGRKSMSGLDTAYLCAHLLGPIRTAACVDI